MTAKRFGGIWAARVTLTIAAMLILLPVAYQIGLSFKPASGIFESPLNPFPLIPSFEHYRFVLSSLPMGLYLLNSLLFSLGVTFGQVLLSVPAAFALAHKRFPLERVVFSLMLLTMMVPFVVTYIPNYLLIAQWGLIGTLPGMILPLIANGYGVFLLRQHFKSFPVSILEAARIDGASDWQTLWLILVPAHRSAISSLTVYLFIQSWNQLVWPLLVGNSSSSWTLTVAVQRFAGSEGGGNWGALMAAAVLASVPTLLLYLLMRRGVLSTFSDGAVKG